jgi:isopenicillin N synthase-like dioxygenase
MLFRLPHQSGLQILLPSGAWVPVPVSPPGTENDPAPPILVNIGDLLSYWTNGLLRSTVHRVVFGGEGVKGETDTEARYSIAYFCHPVGTMPLTAVPSERVRVRGSKGGSVEGEKGRVLTADEHLHMRYVISLVAG